MASREEMSQSFGAQSAAYEAGRPEYPGEAVMWMLEPLDGRPRVADVGAGTGKLLRSILRARDVDAIAVEPDKAMLAALASASPDVETYVGTAEHLPLPDASVDAVVLGQAWHWVEAVTASLEIGRVVRTGGVLGLIWNVRDERVPWVKKLTAIMHGSSAEEMIASGEIPLHAPFGALEEKTWEWRRPMTRGDILSMAQSRSYLITAGDDERKQIMAGIESLLDDEGVIDDAVVQMPYVTKAYRAVRP